LDRRLQVQFHLGEPSPEAVQEVRNQLAFYTGGMGARGKDFYNQLACRYGYEAEATEIQDLYLSGMKAEAAETVPRELLDAITLMGNEDSIRRLVEELKPRECGPSASTRWPRTPGSAWSRCGARPGSSPGRPQG
jgi:hypothetical protein